MDDNPETNAGSNNIGPAQSLNDYQHKAFADFDPIFDQDSFDFS